MSDRPCPTFSESEFPKDGCKHCGFTEDSHYAADGRGGGGMSEYYDRQGNPMTMYQWAQRFAEKDKRVAETTLPNGRRVSTVWLGVNHTFGDGPPLIFATMVFPSKKGPLHELDCERYSTETEALAGHARMVEKWTGEPEARA